VEHKHLLPKSLGPVTLSHPEPDEPSPYLPILFLYVPFPLLRSFQKLHPSPRHCITLCSMLTLYGRELLAPRWRITPCWMFYNYLTTSVTLFMGKNRLYFKSETLCLYKWNRSSTSQMKVQVFGILNFVNW
jgi:hypothetical protein